MRLYTSGLYGPHLTQKKFVFSFFRDKYSFVGLNCCLIFFTCILAALLCYVL